MRKLKILVVTLAMTLLFAAPAFANGVTSEAELLESDAEVGGVLFAEAELLHSQLLLFTEVDEGER